jgi:glycosyltransferase involved in cell wall biosynthesis
MKVAYISTYLPQKCGIATYTDYLIQGIKSVLPEIEITVIAEKEARQVKKDKFEVKPCWTRNEDYVEPILSETAPVEVVHIQHEYSIYKFDSRLPRLLKKLKAKKVITIHCVRPSQFSPRGSIDENFAREIASLCDRVILHLPSQEAILTRLGIPKGKISVIPHGTEVSRENKIFSRRRLNLPLRKKILLMFGFVKPHKCLDIALEALNEVRKEVKEVLLFIAGGLSPTAQEEDRNYLKLIKKKITELKLQKNIIFPNKFFPNRDVPYLFGASDIILFPYYEEDRSASGALHLSIGARKPVVASRIPKFEELKNICDELLVLPYNSLGLAKIITRLIKDREFLKYILSQTETYCQETSWEVTAKKHLQIYKELRS